MTNKEEKQGADVEAIEKRHDETVAETLTSTNLWLTHEQAIEAHHDRGALLEALRAQAAQRIEDLEAALTVTDEMVDRFRTAYDGKRLSAEEIASLRNERVEDVERWFATHDANIKRALYAALSPDKGDE